MEDKVCKLYITSGCPACHPRRGTRRLIHFACAMLMDFNKGVEIETKLALPTDVTMKL